MILREVLAAMLIAAGIAATSYGTGLITPAAGFIALGLQLLALGVTLGIGDLQRSAPDAAVASDDVPLTPATEHSIERDLGGLNPDLSPRLDPATLEGPEVPDYPDADARQPVGRAVIPMSSYLGLSVRERE